MSQEAGGEVSGRSSECGFVAGVGMTDQLASFRRPHGAVPFRARHLHGHVGQLDVVRMDETVRSSSPADSG